jgi:hypothetical protein
VGIYKDALIAKISDLDTAISRVQSSADEQIRLLRAQKQALRSIKDLLTDEIEAAVQALQKAGFGAF